MKQFKATKVLYLLFCFATNLAKNPLQPNTAPMDNSPILVITMPKAATHLMEKTLQTVFSLDCIRPETSWPCDGSDREWAFKFPHNLDWQLRTLQPNSFLLTHLHFSPDRLEIVKKYKAKIILLVRSPKSLAVSFMHWVQQPGHERLYHRICHMSDEELLTDIIQGGHIDYFYEANKKDPSSKSYPNLFEFYQYYTPWLTYEHTLLVNFEKLVGPQGGGTAIEQQNTIRAIKNHLNLDTPIETIQQKSKALFGGTRTFRTGKCNSWVTYFSDSISTLYSRMAKPFTNTLKCLHYTTE